MKDHAEHDQVQRTEEALRESEAVLRSFFDSPGMMRGIVELVDGDILHIADNAVTAAFFGKTKESMRNQLATAMGVPEETVQMWIGHYQQSRRSGEPVHFEYAREVRGRKVWLRATVSCLGTSPAGRPRHAYVVQDISDRKQMEEGMRRGMATMFNLLDAMEDGIYIVDQQYRIQFINSALTKEFGPVEGRTCYEYLDDRRTPCPWCPNDKVFAGNVVHWQWRSPKNGKTYDLLDSPLRNADGSVSKLEILRDITEHERAQQEIERLQTQLARTGRLVAMGEMAAGMAHELNQPLAGVLMFAEAAAAELRRGATTDPQALLGILEDIASEAHLAGQIIRRMRQFVTKIEPHRSRVRLTEVVEGILPLLANEIRVAGAAVAVAFDDSLPDVLADEVQIQQVFVNLLRNALEAMANSPPAARRVEIGAAARADVLEVWVRDNGCGVAEDQMDRLFESFYTTKPNGLGMGLVVSRSIVESHGGHLRAARNVEGGATFTFTLPIAPGSQTHAG